jgi:Cd2+/Zn2+-exporting ATPase
MSVQPNRGQSSTDSAAGAVCDLQVGGMDCPSCADDITRALERLEGVQDVRVNVVGGNLQVKYAEGKLARGDLAGAVRRLGYRVQNDASQRLTFIVDGMDCADEVRQIEAKLGPLPGIVNLQFDLINRRLRVDGSATPAEIQRAIKDIGLTARPEGQATAPLTFWERRGRLTMAAASGALLGIGMVTGWLGGSQALEIAALALAAVAGGWFVVPRGWRAARSGVLDMNFLMTIASMGAAAIGEWAEGASVMFLFSVAQLLETFSMDRARNAIKALMDISPTEATVKRNGREETVPVTEVRVGERIVVRPGQKIPLDGHVTAGTSSVNQAPITGESIPVDKAPGAEVFAGSINEHGLLEVEVTKLVEDTTLARIIHAVEEAQATRAPSRSFVDRFSAVYTPAVVGAAILLIIVPPLLGLGSGSTWFYRALAMLVIACPCALVISTPVSVVSGLAGAARAGILIKGGLHLENAGAATVVGFDKTGTLTEGRPAVAEVLPIDADEREVLRLAASLEQGSEHPLARAILNAAAELKLTLPAVAEFQALVGRGVQGNVEGRTLYLGNERLCREQALWTPPVEAALARVEREGRTAVVLGATDHPLGIIAIGDQVRPNAKAAIEALRSHGIQRVVMLTGDNEGTARAVAQQLGVTEFRAELLPDDKVKTVRDMEASGARVVFVGDGVNDAPALAAATVGVAMGAAGTDVALETADIALMADDLAKLPVALRLSQRTLRIIKQNITLSLVNKGVFVVLAVGGWATLWMAVASDMGVSLVVILNGLRALRTDPVGLPGRPAKHVWNTTAEKDSCSRSVST